MYRASASADAPVIAAYSAKVPARDRCWTSGRNVVATTKSSRPVGRCGYQRAPGLGGADLGDADPEHRRRADGVGGDEEALII
jgi:hypothetical protein